MDPASEHNWRRFLPLLESPVVIIELFLLTAILVVATLGMGMSFEALFIGVVLIPIVLVGIFAPLLLLVVLQWIYKLIVKALEPKMLMAIGVALIPLVIAGGGWWVQQSIENSTLDLNYVQAAISILQNKDTGSDLRGWAIDVMDNKSPVPFTQALQQNLIAGSTSFPYLFNFNVGPSAFLVTSTASSGFLIVGTSSWFTGK